MVKRTWPDLLWPLCGFAVVVFAVLWVAHQSGTNVLTHSAYDTYSWQAMVWRSGHIVLPGDRQWLELAVYQGHFWVSFPPLPAVPMLILSFFFGENTPSGAVVMVYFFGGLVALYVLLRRYQRASQATLWMVFVALGGTVLSLAVAGRGTTGGVWFQAQLMAFLLTALAFVLVDGKSRIGWGIGLACLALSVGCRPFNLVYLPVLLWMLLGHLGQERRAALPFLIAPAVIAAIFGIYNAVRFGSPLQFGHKYLPELTRSHQGMFMASKVPENIGNVLRAPSVEQGKLTFPQFSGFAIYLTNPMLLIGAGVIIARGLRRNADVIDALLLAALVIHGLMLLSHRTNGGYQYGTRYLIDLLPAATYAVARGGTRVRTGAGALFGAVVAFNLIATATFETMP